MTQTIRDQLERWTVEEPVGDGTYRKVPLMEYADRYAAEAVAVERARWASPSGIHLVWHHVGDHQHMVYGPFSDCPHCTPEAS
jgi:hypothetical protein